MSREYDEYLEAHIGAVQKAGYWMVDNMRRDIGLTDDEVVTFRYRLPSHDDSKYDDVEYEPYDDYFYGERDEGAFNYAWLHHIHANPHHWQHWLLMYDDGKYRDPKKLVALEMPRVCALEMIADWWSFSWRNNNLYEIFDWYESHKDCIVLHPDTREYVETVLGNLREALDGEATGAVPTVGEGE